MNKLKNNQLWKVSIHTWRLSTCIWICPSLPDFQLGFSFYKYLKTPPFPLLIQARLPLTWTKVGWENSGEQDRPHNLQDPVKWKRKCEVRCSKSIKNFTIATVSIQPGMGHSKHGHMHPHDIRGGRKHTARGKEKPVGKGDPCATQQDLGKCCDILSFCEFHKRRRTTENSSGWTYQRNLPLTPC